MTQSAVTLPAEVIDFEPPDQFWQPLDGAVMLANQSAKELPEPFEPRRVLRRRALLDVQPRQPADLNAFVFDPEPAHVDESSSGVHIEWSQRTDLCLALPIDLLDALSTAQTSAIEVEVAGLRGRPLDLRWRTRTPKGMDGGSLTAHVAQDVVSDLSLDDVELGDLDEVMQRYRFAMSGIESWRGEVVGLELCNSEWIERLWLRSITAWEERIDTAEVESLDGRLLRVELDNDVRDALIVTPASRSTLPIAADRAGDVELRTAVGVLPGSPPLRFHLHAGDRSLWTDEIRAEDGWREVRVPLALEGEVEGRSVQVRLEVEAVHGGDALAVGFWQAPTLLRATPEPPLNLILISVDTLRADHLSLYGYERETSPHLDRWAEERAVVFERAIAASPWTLPSHTSMFTGLDAHRHGVNLVTEHVPPGLPLLAERLRQAGYYTRAITGGGYLHPQFGLARGFDAYRYWGDRRSDSSRHELATHSRQLYRWLRDNVDRPFFLFFHTYAVHGPLSAHAPYYEQFGGRLHPGAVQVETAVPAAQDGYRLYMRAAIEDAEGRRLLTPDELNPFYDSGIAEMDRVLGELFAVLDALDLSRRTVVLLTSDHGELLGEYGVYDHHYLYDENLQVPFVLGLPEARFLPAATSPPGRAVGRTAGRRVAAQVRNVDVTPTLLELAGLEVDASVQDLDGRSVLALLRGEVEASPPAWSYAANSNYGLALQDERAKVIESASAWAGSRESNLPTGMEDVRQDDAEAARQLQRQLRRGFVRDASGYRLRLQNARTDATWTGSVEWTPKPPVNALKSIDLPADCAQWAAHGSCLQGAEDKAQRFQVLAATSYTMLVESAPREVRLRAGWSGEPAVETWVDLTRQQAFVALRFDDRGWQRLDRLLRPDETGMLLWWDGPAGSRSTSDSTEASLPAELELQLRALGYLQ